MNRRKFTNEQKSNIVLELLTNKHTPTELCKKHNIQTPLLYRWRDEFIKNAASVFKKQPETLESEKIKNYEHIIAKLTTQNDFLDKVLAIVR